MNKKLYLCKCCRQVHYDDDFCEIDGDLEIRDFEKFLENVEKIKNENKIISGLF